MPADEGLMIWLDVPELLNKPSSEIVFSMFHMFDYIPLHMLSFYIRILSTYAMWATKPLIPPKGNLKVTTYYDILDIQVLCCLKDDSAPMHKVRSLKKWLSKSFLEEPDYAA